MYNVFLKLSGDIMIMLIMISVAMNSFLINFMFFNNISAQTSPKLFSNVMGTDTHKYYLLYCKKFCFY